METSGKALAGKKALVTGAAGGIGLAIVAALRAKGAVVAAADKDTSGIDADHHLPGDLLNHQYTDHLPQAAADAMGGLDIVINNAGVITRGDVTETSDADYALSLGVNVDAPFRICRAAIPIMAEAGGGVIVNTASCWGGKAPGPNHAIYCMTKAAIASLTQCMGGWITLIKISGSMRYARMKSTHLCCVQGLKSAVLTLTMLLLIWARLCL